MHGVMFSIWESQKKAERSEDRLVHIGDFKEDCVAYCVCEKLGGHFVAVGVPAGEDAHERIRRQEPVGVHGTDVVQHVPVVNGYTHEDHQEVEPEQHLDHAP